MSQLIVVLNDKELTKILQGKLSSKYGFEVIVKPSSTDAISILQILPDIELILCCDVIGKDPVAQKIGEWLNANKETLSKEIDLVILGEKTTNYPKAIAIGANPSYQKIIDYIGFLLGKETSEVSFEEEPPEEKTTVFQMPKLEKAPVVEVAPEPVAEKKVPQYYAFSMKYFLNLPEVQTTFGIYTRIKKQNEYEYNLKIATNTIMTKVEIDKLAMRTGKELFVSSEERQVASEFLNSYFLSKFKSPDLNIFDRMQMNSDSYEILLDVFKTSSIDKYSVEIIKEIVKSIDLLVKNPDSLTVFKTALNTKKLSYGYTHSYFSCVLVFMIIDKFPWSQEYSKNKIIYMSLFHDLCLNNDRLIKLHHHYFQELKNISEEEKNILNNHADQSATVLEAIVKAPKELTMLIREHHGLKNGKGFLDTLSIAISPFSMAFVVTEEVVTQYLDAFEKLDKAVVKEVPKQTIEAFFVELKKKYEKHTYRDVLLELEKILVKA